MLAAARIDVFIDVFFLQIEESAVVFRITTNKVLKRLMSYLCHKAELAIVLKQVAYFKCIHPFYSVKYGSPEGNRTPVTGLKGRRSNR